MSLDMTTLPGYSPVKLSQPGLFPTLTLEEGSGGVVRKCIDINQCDPLAPIHSATPVRTAYGYRLVELEMSNQYSIRLMLYLLRESARLNPDSELAGWATQKILEWTALYPTADTGLLLLCPKCYVTYTGAGEFARDIKPLWMVNDKSDNVYYMADRLCRTCLDNALIALEQVRKRARVKPTLTDSTILAGKHMEDGYWLSSSKISRGIRKIKTLIQEVST